jgi:quinone-modifying oxidoreductase subunit QmoB
MEKVGVFLCTGCDIGAAIKTDDLEEVCTEGGASHYMAHECLCAPEGLKGIHKAIEDGTVDGAVIAACTQRAKTEEFTFDPLKVAWERCALREQVAWSHPHGDEDTQMLAEDLLRMYVTRVSKMELPKPLEEQINGTVLVVGGGLTGLTAAKVAASMGRKVVLVEKSDKLGGYLGGVKDLVPEEPPYDRVHENYIGALVSEVESNSEIRVIKGCTIKSIDGQPGQFKVKAQSGSGEEDFEAGVIVQSTGAKPYDAGQLGNLGYGKSKNVVGSHELEKMLKDGKLARPSDGKEPGTIVFVQCAGSRDENHLAYCSSECCVTTLKQVATIHRDFPKVQCQVIYKDLRAPGQLEHFYEAVPEKTGCMLTRGEVDSVEGNGKLSVNVKESLLGDAVTLEADMVVLALGMVPNSADGESIRELTDAKARVEKGESETQIEDGKKKIEELKAHEGTEILNLGYRQGPDLPALRYGFPDSHYICFPYESRRTGIYAAGTMRAPMDAAQAAEDAWGAAMKAVQCISALERGEAVHPRSGDIAIADFSLQRCTQCKRCTEECPFGTLNEDEKGTPEYNILRCRRCGICLGSCPERIVAFPEYSVDAVAGMIKSIEVPDEDEEKPRIVALMCENDALPALDEAAAKRKQWNQWVRIVPVRCLGACNVVWIADSLSRGVDGIILIGCKKGDDYQCHYIKGSELAEYRMDNVKETLERLSLESERVKIVELARDEFERIPEILDEFAETIDDVGPNPYKGF